MKREARILIACEESGIVAGEFVKLGYTNVWSCDLLPTSGNYPERHLQQDVLPLLNEKWDMIIAFPPCTHLCVAGSRWFTEGKKPIELQYQARDFFMTFANADCPRIAIENPVGRMSTYWRKPDQIINPWQFGDTTNKKTCLWLKGLPRLVPTDIVPADNRTNEIWLSKFGGKFVSWSSEECKRLRSKTFPGIARAMAEQWAGHIGDQNAARIQD